MIKRHQDGVWHRRIHGLRQDIGYLPVRENAGTDERVGDFTILRIGVGDVVALAPFIGETGGVYPPL